MFLQQCVPPAYKYVIQGSSSLIACFQRLEALCTDERMYYERIAAQRNPRSFHEDKGIGRNNYQTRRNKPGEKRKLICRECKKANHANLLGCPNLKKYLPGEPNSSSSLTKEICRLCLGTLFNDYNHASMREHKKYRWEKSDTFFLVCHKCKKHKRAQKWMRANHKPEKGRGNLHTM